MRLALRALIVPLIFTGLMAGFLVGLGVWQLQRLSWKTAILTKIEARTHAAAQTLPPPSAWAALAADDYEYRRVELDGTFDHKQEALVFRGTAAGPGYFVLTPLHLRSGGTVIVNRGFVPLDRADPRTRAAGLVAGLVHVGGLMRSPEARNPFTPQDDPPAGRYFTRDPGLIAAHFGLRDAAPFSLDTDATPVPGGWPRGGTTEIAISNNHLSYALTWFGLALGLIGVFAAFAWRRLRPAPAGLPDPIAGSRATV